MLTSKPRAARRVGPRGGSRGTSRSVIDLPLFSVLFCAHVVAHQLVLIAQIHSPPNHHWLGPARIAADVLRFERAFNMAAARRGFDQRDLTALITKNQIS